MLFWLVSTMMTFSVFVLVVTPLFRPPKQDGHNPDVTMYKAQLAELDRDIARQTIAPDEAERTKAEIARRLLSAAKQQQPSQAKSGANAAGLGISLSAAGVAFATYISIGAPGYPDMPLKARYAEAAEVLANRPDQATAEASARQLSAPEVPAEYLASVEELRKLVPERGDDLQGWELLAYHESRLRNFSAAARAQAQVLDLKGTSATADDMLRHADLLVAAADGYVSPEAESQVRKALQLAPNSVAGQYYLGALYDQTGRSDLAFGLWRSILESNAPESLYTTLARGQIGGAAFRAGTDYTPPSVSMAQATLPGPTAEQMQDAQEMDPEARQQMIEGMVNNLADRLATEGGTVQEWARLISAYGVLGRTEDARTVLTEARQAFAGSQEAITLLDQAAEGAGLD